MTSSRYEALGNAARCGKPAELRVRVAFGKDGKTLTITDNGIGLWTTETIDNLGTIAKRAVRATSSTNLEPRKGRCQTGRALIGRSSVWASDLSSPTRSRCGIAPRRPQGRRGRALDPAAAPNEFEVEASPVTSTGTSVILHLRDDALECL